MDEGLVHHDILSLHEPDHRLDTVLVLPDIRQTFERLQYHSYESCAIE